MDQSQGSNGFPWSEWMESAANLWLSAAQSWQELSTSLAGCSRTEEYHAGIAFDLAGFSHAVDRRAMLRSKGISAALF